MLWYWPKFMQGLIHITKIVGGKTIVFQNLPRGRILVLKCMGAEMVPFHMKSHLFGPKSRLLGPESWLFHPKSRLLCAHTSSYRIRPQKPAVERNGDGGSNVSPLIPTLFPSWSADDVTVSPTRCFLRGLSLRLSRASKLVSHHISV